MIRTLILLLLLSGCTTDIKSIQAQAVKKLSVRYDLSECSHNIPVIKLSRKMPGYFDDESGKIYIISDDPVVLEHEIIHRYMWLLNIPVDNHHKTMEEMGLY